jgi:hypothetical protein
MLQIRNVVVEVNGGSDSKACNGDAVVVNGAEEESSNDSASKSDSGSGRRRSLSVDGSNGVENRPKKPRKEINQVPILHTKSLVCKYL